MPSRSFHYPISGQPHIVTVSQVAYGGEGWQVYLNDYYQGTIGKERGEWVAHMNRGCRIHGDDLGALIDILSEFIPPSILLPVP